MLESVEVTVLLHGMLPQLVLDAADKVRVLLELPLYLRNKGGDVGWVSVAQGEEALCVYVGTYVDAFKYRKKEEII